jgi:hypothetical protein
LSKAMKILVTQSSSPPAWLRSTSEYCLQEPRKRMACFLPVHPYLSGSSGFQFLKGFRKSPYGIILSCLFTPPRRLHLSQAAFLLGEWVDPIPRSKSASVLLGNLTAYTEREILHERTPGFPDESWKMVPSFQEVSFLGLATHLRRISTSHSLKASFSSQRS